MKICEQCSAEIPNAHFHRKFCDDCRKARQLDYNKKWQKANPEKVSAHIRKWQKANPEKVSEYGKRQRAKNPNYIIEYREKNKDKIDKQLKEYLQRPEVKARIKAYSKKPDVVIKRRQKSLENYTLPLCNVCGALCPKGFGLCYEHSPKHNTELALEKKREWEADKRKNNVKNKLDTIIASGQYNSIIKIKKKPTPRKWERILGYSDIDLITRLETNFEDDMTWSNYGRSKNGNRAWEVSHIVKGYFFDYETLEDEGFHLYWSLDNLLPRWADENIDKNKKY